MAPVHRFGGGALICRGGVFGVSVGEAEEVILVQVHDDQLVRGSQVHGHLGELLVKVTSVSTAPLQVVRVMEERRERKQGGGEGNKEEDGMNRMGEKRKHQLRERIGRKTGVRSTGSERLRLLKSIRATIRHMVLHRDGMERRRNASSTCRNYVSDKSVVKKELCIF